MFESRRDVKIHGGEYFFYVGNTMNGNAERLQKKCIAVFYKKKLQILIYSGNFICKFFYYAQFFFLCQAFFNENYFSPSLTFVITSKIFLSKHINLFFSFSPYFFRLLCPFLHFSLSYSMNKFLLPFSPVISSGSSLENPAFPLDEKVKI